MILSQSIKIPKMFNIISGSTQYVNEMQAVDQSLRMLLKTAKGELFGDPNFGTNLYTFIYDVEGDTLNQLIKEEIVTCVSQQCPRVYISQDDIQITAEDKTLLINISYHIRYSNYSSNFSLSVQRRQEV